MARAYQNQVASLQQSLVQSEHSLQELERQLADMRSGHHSEVESIVKQQEAIRESALQERDQKHAAHILRLTAELSAQQEFVDSGKPDLDEQEAERIQMIKASMKELHEKEKAQIQQEHEAEKLRLADEFRKQMEANTQQMEQVANSKIQEVHAQFMSAHQALLEQKNAAELHTEEVKNQLQQTTSQMEALTAEKRSLEEQYRTLLESHSAEVEEMSTNARDLEERVNTWKDKAANLESRLELSGKSQESGMRQVQEQYEMKFQSATSQYKEQVAGLESLVKQYTEENAMLQEQLQRAVDESVSHHQEELDQLKSQHGSEVELLEKSISEALTEKESDKASLEAAEEHMSSLQKQLKAYRRQESDMNAKMNKLQEDQALVIELLKQRHEQEKTEELKSLRSQFTTQIEKLQMELSIAQDVEQTGQLKSETQHVHLVEELQSRHKEELVETKRALCETHEQALASLQSELEDTYQKNFEMLKQQHKSELEQLSSTLAVEWSAKLKAARADVKSELEEARDTEIEELQTKHANAIKELQQSLEQQEKAALSEISSRIVSLESELSRLHEDEAEWLELRKDMMSQLELSQRELEEEQAQLAQAKSTEAQLREECQGLKCRIQSVESDCHIAQSASANMQQSLEHAQTQVKELTAKVEELQGEIQDVESIEAASREQAQKLLQVTDQLAERNVTIADLQSQNDTLNTEVFALTQKCQQQVSSIQMLQRQIENVGAVSEEISTLQQQLSELAPIKEQHTQLKQTLSQVEVAVQSKDREIHALQSKLEHFAQMEEQVSRFEMAVQSKDEEVEVLQAELESYTQIKEQVVQLEATVQSKDSEINSLRTDLDQAGIQMKEMKAQWGTKLKEVTANSSGEIEVLKTQIASHCAQEDELRQKIQQQAASLAQIESAHHAQQEELSNANEEMNRLKVELQEALNRNSQLQGTNQTLTTQLEMSREQSESVESDTLANLKSKHEELELRFATLTVEKERVTAELARLQEEANRREDEYSSSWEVKVRQLEETIGDLRSQLNAKDVAYTEMQSELTQKLAQAEIQERSLRQSLESSQLAQGGIRLVSSQKSALEDSLSRARRKLMEKLHEKEALEKDLSFHRTELERRLGEKQRLEGLLFEKARFEQELVNQKEQLQLDLKQIESKLQLQVGRVEQGQQYDHLTSRVTAHNQQIHLPSFVPAHQGGTYPLRNQSTESR